MPMDTETVVVNTIPNEAPSANADDSVPKWLDKEFLEKHLRNYFGNKQITIVNFEVKPATAKGENYASYLYRVKLTYSNEGQTCSGKENSPSTMNIIIKAGLGLPGDFAFEALKANNAYEKEIEFYSKIAPKINQTLKKLNETAQLIPEPYGVCHENSAILFEDLSAKGYGIASVYRGYSLEEAKLVLRKAATLHAINAVLQEKDPNIFENFKYGAITRHTNVYDIFYLTQLDVMMEVVATWPDGDYYNEKFKRLRGNLMERSANQFKPEPNHFNALSHGDMWVNNIMVKYLDEIDSRDDSKASIENMIFVDFQFCCWTSPTMDLHYFFNNSLQESLRPDRFDDLLEFYHGNLADFLKRLEYKKHIPTLDELKQQYIDKRFYAFVVSCLIQPLMINEDTAEADVEALITGDERSMKFKRTMYSSPKVRANLRKLIPIFDSMGLFD